MLGFEFSERTISRWMKRAPRDPEPGKRWLAFLRNHQEVIAAMDFFTVPTIRFGVLYCFFVVAHDRRRVLHCNVSKHPTSRWVVQQLRVSVWLGSAVSDLRPLVTLLASTTTTATASPPATKTIVTTARFLRSCFIYEECATTEAPWPTRFSSLVMRRNTKGRPLCGVGTFPCLELDS